jgi:hypothetical protein
MNYRFSKAERLALEFLEVFERDRPLDQEEFEEWIRINAFSADEVRDAAQQAVRKGWVDGLVRQNRSEVAFVGCCEFVGFSMHSARAAHKPHSTRQATNTHSRSAGLWRTRTMLGRPNHARLLST